MLSNSLALPCVLELLSKGHGDPAGEQPLDAAPARCPEIAARFGKHWSASEAQHFDSGAEWVATDKAFYYVWPASGDTSRLAWKDVRSVLVGRKKKIAPRTKTRVVSLQTTDGGSFNVETGPRAAKSLRNIFKHS